MERRLAVLNVVGLTHQLLGPRTPHLSRFAAAGASVPVVPVLPAVTCPVQASFLTGETPAAHGIVGNGWYFRDECEVRLWRQSNRLVTAEKVWETARRHRPDFTCANLFWWFNMYSSADYAVTPRPMYPADGRKLPDVYTRPAELRTVLQGELGTFPLFRFWGPGASIESTRWIASSACLVETMHRPTLSLVYLPHLDYGLQRHGPLSPATERDLQDVDAVCGELIDFYQERGVDVLVLSEYGITEVSQPVHLNRVLRQHDLLQVRRELGLEVLDAGASAAFAVADHQVAHVYVNEPSRLPAVRELLESCPGVDRVLDAQEKRAAGLDHSRSGDLVAVAEPRAWFTYYYWLDDLRAPDFARTVDIHRKPGYDPAELFFDPALRWPQLRVGLTLLQRRLGGRRLLEVVPLDATLVRGSHGRLPPSPEQGPLLISGRPELLDAPAVEAAGVRDLLLRHLDLPAPAPAEAATRAS